MTDDEKRASVKKDYDQVAEKYYEYWKEDWENKTEIDQFISLLKPGGKILDIGSGTGYITKYLKDCGLDPIGIDFSKGMLDIAVRLYPELQFINCDASNITLNFEKESFDGAIALYSLFHIPKGELPNVLCQIYQVLKKNSPLLIIMQEGEGEKFLDEPLIEGEDGKNVVFCNLYKKEELETLLRTAHFEIQEFIIKQNTDPGEVSEGGRFLVIALKK